MCDCHRPSRMFKSKLSPPGCPMGQAKGTVSVWCRVAVSQRRACHSFMLSTYCLLLLTLGLPATLAAETLPLDHDKPASVAPPTKLGNRTPDEAKQKALDPAQCSPSAEPGKAGDSIRIAAPNPDATVKNNKDANSRHASDLSVKLPAHEELQKDEIRLPADTQGGAEDVNQDKERLQVGLKDRADEDRESEPENAVPGSPAQCTLPSAQSGTGSPVPH